METLYVLCFLIGFLSATAYRLHKEYHAPRFGPFGPELSRAEEAAKRKLDATAEYHIVNEGMVPVKNYRWSREWELLVLNNKPTSYLAPHFIKYRRDRDNPEWFPYQEKLGEDGYWDYIGSCEHRIEYQTDLEAAQRLLDIEH